MNLEHLESRTLFSQGTLGTPVPETATAHAVHMEKTAVKTIAQYAAESGITTRVMTQLLKDNPGLSPDFIFTAPPSTPIVLSNGKTYPLYQLDQFQTHNFQLTLESRKKEGDAEITSQNWKLHRLLCLPAVYDWVYYYHPTYKVNGIAVSQAATYAFLRGLHNTVGVTVKPGEAPHGGGAPSAGLEAAPSWAVWLDMAILFHEAANSTKGFSGDDPVLTGVLAGRLKEWDNAKLWDYTTIDVNTLATTNGTPPG